MADLDASALAALESVQTALEAIQTAVESGGDLHTAVGDLQSSFAAELSTDPATVNTAAVDTSLTLGKVYSYEGKLYKYVQFLDAVAYEAGDVCEWANATGTAVTNDKAGGSSVGRLTAGIALAVMTQNQYGFVLVNGYYAAVNTDGGVSEGEFLISDTVDGDADTMAAGEEHLVFGMALADDTAADATATVAAMVNCL